MSLIRFYEFISNIRPQCVIRPTCKNIKVWLSFNNRIKGTNLLSIDAIRKYIQPLYCISLGYCLKISSWNISCLTLPLIYEMRRSRWERGRVCSSPDTASHFICGIRYAALLMQLKLILVWRLPQSDCAYQCVVINWMLM